MTTATSTSSILQSQEETFLSSNDHAGSPSPDLLNLIRSQVEYYFSPHNLANDAYLKSVMTTNNGRAPTSLIATFPKIQLLYNSVLPSDDCITVVTKAMLTSNVVRVDGHFLCPVFLAIPSESTPKRLNTIRIQIKIEAENSINPLLSATASTCSASTRDEYDWAKETTQINLTKGTNNNTVATCSPTSFEDDATLAATSMNEDIDIAIETDRTVSCSEEICNGINNLIVDCASSPVNDHNGIQNSTNQPANFGSVELEQQYTSSSNAYPLMATVPVDPFYSQYMYPPHQYYYPVQQNANLHASVVADPFYYYNMYHGYHYQTNIPQPRHYNPVDHRLQHHPHAESVIGNLQQSFSNSKVANNVDEYDASRDDSSLPNVVFVSSSPATTVTDGQNPPTIKQLNQKRASLHSRSQTIDVPVANRKSNRGRKNSTNNRTSKGSKDQQTSVVVPNDGSGRISKQKSNSSQEQIAGATYDNIKGQETIKKKKSKRSTQNSTNQNRRSKHANSGRVRDSDKKILTDENFPALVPVSSPSLNQIDIEESTRIVADVTSLSRTITEGIVFVSPKKTGYAEALLKQRTGN